MNLEFDLLWYDFEYLSLVPDPGKGVCGDPVNGAAILEKGGPDPQGTRSVS